MSKKKGCERNLTKPRSGKIVNKIKENTDKEILHYTRSLNHDLA